MLLVSMCEMDDFIGSLIDMSTIVTCIFNGLVWGDKLSDVDG